MANQCKLCKESTADRDVVWADDGNIHLSCLVRHYEELNAAAKAALEALRYMRDVDTMHWGLHVTPEICNTWDNLRSAVGRSKDH